MGPKKEEKRKFARVKDQCSVSYSIIPQGKTGRKMTLDLSQGGLRFISDHFIPLHSNLKIEIKLKDIPKAISAIIKPIWIKEIFDDERYELGAEFVHINSEDLKFLKDYFRLHSD